jgi:glutathione peroxidase
VNTASDCGFTQQYAELQQLYEARKPALEIIAFPSNDFKQQEKKNDTEIAQFCRTNFGITFPLAAKSSVTRSPMQHPVFEWLSNAKKNGWNDQAPSWNFSKYLVNETGMLTHCFDPSVSPSEKIITDATGKSNN